MDYTIHSHEELVDRVYQYLSMMRLAKFEKQKPRADQSDFWYKYSKIKDSIEHYVKQHKSL